MRRFLRSTSELLILGGLILVFVFIFASLQANTGSPSAAQGVSGINCSPDTQFSEESSANAALTSPIRDPFQPSAITISQVQPKRGMHVSSPTLVVALSSSVQIGDRIAWHGNRLIVPIIDAQRGNCLVEFDLDVKRSKIIATFKGNLADFALSDQYLVWSVNTNVISANPCPLESPLSVPGTSIPTLANSCIETPPQDHTEVHIYSFQSQREIDHHAGVYRSINLADDVLVWQDLSGIHSQHLASGQSLTATAENGSYPKIAGDWIVYVVRSKEFPMLAADLHLYNLQTTDDKIIGTVSNQVNGGGYAIDEKSLVWLKISIKPEDVSLQGYELHIYTLATGEDHTLDIGNKSYLADLHLVDDLLVYLQMGWQAIDLKNNLKFDIFPLSDGWQSLHGLALYGGRLIWADTSAGHVELYLAQIDSKQ